MKQLVNNSGSHKGGALLSKTKTIREKLINLSNYLKRPLCVFTLKAGCQVSLKKSYAQKIHAKKKKKKFHAIMFPDTSWR